MPTDVIMPQMGESIFEGTITKWLKQPGDQVQRDEPLFEISTDKVDAEIPAPASGVLKEIKAQAGQTVQVNTVVATIDAAGSAAAATTPGAKQSATEPPKAASQADGSNAPAPSTPRHQFRFVLRTKDGRRHAADGRIDFRRHHHQVAQKRRRHRST